MGMQLMTNMRKKNHLAFRDDLFIFNNFFQSKCRMFKKSVVSGLMLSTSVLGIAGCSVPQKEAVSDKAEHVAKDPASEVTTKLASSVVSRPEQPVSTTSQETVVPMTQAPTISAEALKQDVVAEPVVETAKPVETVANNAPVVETNTYQAKPTFVELSAPKVVAPTVEATVNTAVEKPVEAPVVNASAHNEVVEKQDDVKDEKATVEATPAVTENKQEVATEQSVQPATEKPAEPVAKEEPKVEIVEKPAEVVEQPAPQAQPQVEPVAETPAVEEKVQEPAPTIKPETRQHPQYNSDASSYPTGQCTWGVKTVAPWVGDYWGNGGQWAESAARDGFRTGKTAEVGSVASWDDGGYGHVAYVTDVDPATGYVKVLEANYNGDQSIGDHRGWFDASNPTWGNVTYIYQN